MQDQDIESLINLIEHETIILSDSIKVNVINDGPEDNKFLACALEAEADYIISGDKHLLNLHHYKEIPIITVREFLKIIEYKLNKCHSRTNPYGYCSMEGLRQHPQSID